MEPSRLQNGQRQARTVLARGCRVVLSIVLMNCLFASSTFAGTILDQDGDSIPDVFDNCTTSDNGPTTVPPNNQLDCDGDGYGTACDGDYNNDGTVGVGDFPIYFNAFIQFPQPDPVDACFDHNADGVIGIGDFAIFFDLFIRGVPGPSCCGTF